MNKKTGKTIWVLTREINAYDQEGAYFECAFVEKPTLRQLADYFAKNGDAFANPMEAISFLEHLREGGGRRGTEDTWFNLCEMPLLGT